MNLYIQTHATIYMRKFASLIALLLLTSIGVPAQSPKAVFKSIADGDSDKATERLEKISIKTRQEMPEMCTLAEAAVLALPERSLEEKIRGYEIFASHADEIRSSVHVEKVFKGDDISIYDVIRNIESASFNAVMHINTEETYRKYYALALGAEHSELNAIGRCVEEATYGNVMRSNDEQACIAFMEEFPRSEYITVVEGHRADIRYNEAMQSTDEATLESFIEEFKSYRYVDKVKTRLMNQRYQRIVRSNDLEQMRWFVETYPKYTDINRLKQTMANIEYPTLDDSREALERFISYYPAVRQVGEAKSRLNVLQIIDRCDIGEIFRYIKQHGYEASYTRMHRAIAKKFGFLILSNDISKVSMVRFVDRDGKIGYLSHDCRVVITPQYDDSTYLELNIPCQSSSDVFELLTTRKLALVVKDGLYGAINTAGQLVIPAKYQNIALLDSEVACIISTSANSEGHGTIYKCAIYDYNGILVEEERELKIGTGIDDYNNWDTTWFSANIEVKDTYNPWEKDIYSNGRHLATIYGGFNYLSPDYRWFRKENNENIYAISRNGKVTTLMFRSYDIEIIFDNIIMAESISSGNRLVIDLDSGSIKSSGKFRDMHPMAEDMILVQYTDNTFGYVGRSLTPMINTHYDRAYSFSCGTAAVILDNKGYLINKRGEQISDTYEDIAPLTGYKGLYKVMKDGKCGIIDANDDIIIAIEHEPLRSNHYTSDRLASIYCIKGIIEWAGGEKTPLY